LKFERAVGIWGGELLFQRIFGRGLIEMGIRGRGINRENNVIMITKNINLTKICNKF